MRGWTRALEAGGIDPEGQVVLHAPYTLEGGAGAISELADRGGPLPRAIYCASDELARGVLSQASRLGLTVPGDLALISVGGTRAGAFSNPPLSSLYWPNDRLASAIVEALFADSPTDDLAAGMSAELRLGRSCDCA